MAGRQLQTGDAAKPRPLSDARSWEPPPTQGPTERARLSERAHQDRDIVYSLQSPETNAFQLSHDYTESREGTDKYLNIVRMGSKVSDPSGRILDTGEAMKVDVLTGAQLKEAAVDAGDEKVAPDQQVVIFRFPAVKKSHSVRLRISKTYTAPQSYRLEGDELAAGACDVDGAPQGVSERERVINPWSRPLDHAMGSLDSARDDGSLCFCSRRAADA